MSRATPLVYLARSAEQRARQIIPGCVENEVAAAISRGDVVFRNGEAVIAGDGWAAVAVRTPGQLRTNTAGVVGHRSQPHGDHEEVGVV